MRVWAFALMWSAAPWAGGCGRIGYDLLSLGAVEDAGTDAGGGGDAGDSGPGVDAGAQDSGADADSGTPGDDAGADAGVPCEEDPCRLVLPQCGCAADEMCQRTIRGDNFRECVPPGDNGRDEPCTQSVQCITGHTCVGFGGDGICSRYCYGSAECADAASQCVEFTAPSEGVGACTPICDPVLNTGCAEGYGCHLVVARRVEDAGDAPVTVCGPADGQGGGSPCKQLCAPGFMCLGDALCHEVCVVGDATTCSVGASCAPLGAIVIDGVEYGTCQ